MKEFFLILFFFHFGFISNIDIDIEGEEGTYNLTTEETYNFYFPIERMIQIEIHFTFINLSYVPFYSIYLNEYSSRNGTSLRNYTIEDVSCSKPKKNCYYSFYYDVENFSSTYLSFSFESNSTVDRVNIRKYFDGGLYNLSNGIPTVFDDLLLDIPYYFVIPVKNSKINVELYTEYNDDFENINLTLIEYQENNPDCYLYVKQDFTNYKIVYTEDEEKIISFNYVIKNNNSNNFCLKFRALKNDISQLKVTLNEDRYYYTLYNKKSLDIFDLQPGEASHIISLKAKNNYLFTINYVINPQNINNTLPLESMTIYEDKSEFSKEHLSKDIHNIKALSESFLYLVSQSKTKYLSLNITPQLNISKFSISYSMTKVEIIEKNIKNNTLFSLSRLNPYSTYKFNINSKTLAKLEYEISIKYSDITPHPFDNISLIENPSKISKIDKLSFTKTGNYLKANSYFVNSQGDTSYTTFLIKSFDYVESFSIKVKVIGDNFYYLTKEVKKNIQLILSKKEYYFAINIDKTLKNVLIYIYTKYKLNKNYPYYNSIDYYTESKNGFELKNGFYLRSEYDKHGNEYNSSANLDFTSQTNPFYNFDILLLKMVSEYNLDDFNIEYKYVDKGNNVPTEKKSNVWVYIVISIGAFLALVTVITSAKHCRKKKIDLNLIEDNTNENINLLPQDNKENQETQETQETQENKDENK